MARCTLIPHVALLKLLACFSDATFRYRLANLQRFGVIYRTSDIWNSLLSFWSLRCLLLTEYRCSSCQWRNFRKM